MRMVDTVKPARHVAILMGGTARWAAARDLSELEGQHAALRAARTTIAAARKRGVPFLTLFAFAAATWNRPRAEIAAALDLLGEFARTERERLIHRKIRVNVIGSLDDFPTHTRHALESLVESTATGSRMTLTLALSYGAQRDIAEAARWIAARVRAGLALPEDIDEAYFRNHLATRELPPLDLLIRTGGERRLSDFLLFEAANAEVLFVLRPWPDFDARALDRAFERYARRRRRHLAHLQAVAQGLPGCVHCEIATAASDAGPALGSRNDGARADGAAKIVSLHGPFA